MYLKNILKKRIRTIVLYFKNSAGNYRQQPTRNCIVKGAGNVEMWENILICE